VGSGGSGTSYGTSDADSDVLRDRVRRELERQEFIADVNEYLGELLAQFNDRDVETIARRLDELIERLGEAIEGVDRLLFGGSIAKHTFVDGLSDVDALVLMRGEQPDDPSDLVEAFAKTLRDALHGSDVSSVEAGRLAVTVVYRDGTEIQLLPAVEKEGKVSIPSEDGRAWRDVRPRKFAEKLTAVNQANGGGVVPVTKLAKALLAQLPDSQKLSGYHIEAIAVDAFESYQGLGSRQAMLRHLLDHASRAALSPTGDITGQTIHIDDHLGPARSSTRMSISASIRRIVRRMDYARSVADYAELFDDVDEGGR